MLLQEDGNIMLDYFILLITIKTLGSVADPERHEGEDNCVN